METAGRPPERSWPPSTESATAAGRWRAADSAARSPRDRGGRAASRWPWLLLGGAVVWNLVTLRALRLGVAYLDDSSMHEQMVRVATAQLRAGHLPLTSWFPYLGEGSAQFLHYQSLPAIITGAVGLITGPDVAFAWSLYLLLALWPVSVYVAARRFGATRAAAAVSAAMAPFLMSVPGIGYEQRAYVWAGYGVWTQLWAMWTLPLAWGFGWRAIRDGRGRLAAVLLTALTVALHFETGYLALAMPIVFALVAGRPVKLRVRRAAVLLGGSLLCCAWVIVPLIAQRSWAAVNEPLQRTALVNGYGAGQVMRWLVSGQLLDHGRLPVITVAAALGLAIAWLRFAEDADGRALLAALAVCLLLSFGRTTFGSLVDVIPGSRDLFFRRFMMGVQLIGVLLAGRGAAWTAGAVADRIRPRVRARSQWLTPALALGATVAVLVPAWTQGASLARADAADITAQRHADATAGARLDRLIAVVRRDGGGRTYAGTPQNWGARFLVGMVPVFKYLESRDVDEVGYTLRTASLLTDPEYFFDERDPSDDRLFGIRWLILPAGRRPPVAARPVMRAGAFRLWSLPDAGYIRAGRVVGALVADRTNVGTRSIPLLHSDLAVHGDYLALHDRPGAAVGALPAPTGAVPGTVDAQRADLAAGEASATVSLRRPGVAVLSASADSGWTATVDGRAAPTRLIAPALVAVDVPAGLSHVVFGYRGYRGYPELLGLAGLTLAGFALAAAGWPLSRRRRATAAR